MKRIAWLTLLCLSGCGTQAPDPPAATRSYSPHPVQRMTPRAAEVTPQPLSTPSATPKIVIRETPKPQPTAPKVVLVLPSPDRSQSKDLGGPDDPSSAASWRTFAEKCVKQKAFAQASQAYAREAAIYRKKGDPEAAIVEQLKSDRYRTQIELFYWRPSDDPVRPLERLEPAQGCMVGAFIDRDDTLEKHLFGPQMHGDIPQFNDLTGKRHASFFTYLSLQREFPRPWADYVREQGAIPHLAWEPSNLAQVTPQLMETFVDALVDYNGPVIVRFASEMNGDWTRYHDNPARYRQVFRELYQAMRRAPKAALMWCPNAMPADNIDEFYPGDDACDWVGVNFYSVLYLDNDPKRPGDWIHPIDLLNSVYSKYAKRKPIAIGEYAASHQSKLDPTPKIDFARIKMAQLYESLPLLYQGVKLVSWYDCDNITKARSERQLNNFRLTDQPEIVDDYKRWVSSPWYLGAGQSSASRQAHPFPQHLPGSVEVQPWVRSYEPNPQIFLRLDGRLLHVQQLPQGGRFRLPSLKSGKHKLEVLVYEPSGRFVEKRAYSYTLD
ncbi:hypothetical protein ABS71_02340 [bacterium SCN 62-11]|nr:hypothetical protein [Candidatus Eremiobacteraeota bacterium]ODT77844.1 MAG: hypothetical protein ABS71_02340 [bacterium SCN 62-11]